MNWLTNEDKGKISTMIFRDRESSNLRELRRATLDDSLLAKKKKRKFDFEKGIVVEVDSEEESQEISSSSSESSHSHLEDNNTLNDPSHMPSSRSGKVQQASPRRRTLYHGPTIYGAWNNWQPQPLIKVDLMARVLNTKPPPDFLA